MNQSYEQEEINLPAPKHVIGSQGKYQSIDPILFIDIDEHGQFLISKKAVQYILSIETAVSVITIVGSYRTGKSFLLNRFLGCQKGFELGPSTNPCTKGIWIWGKTSVDENMTVLYLDTEGLNSYSRDENNDARLLVLACILSSTLLYNIMGVIDEKTLETLSFTTNITQHMIGDDEFLSQYLPHFVWVVRDFCLDLGDKTPDMYMEACLSLIQGEGEEIDQKNRIRMAINKYFKKRSCFTLVRPVSDERLLRQLDKVGYNELRSEFRVGVEILIDAVNKKLQPKVYKNTAMNGQRLVELVTNMVQAINSDGVPNIENAWDRIVSKEFKKLMERLRDVVTKEIALPMPVEQLSKEIGYRYHNCLKEIIGYSISDEKRLEGIIQLQELVQTKNETLMSENNLKAKKINQTIAKQVSKIYETLNNLSDQKKLTTVIQVINQIPNLKKIFFQEAKPPSHHESYIQLLELIFSIIEKVYNSNVLQWQVKEENYKQEIEVLQGQLKTVQQLMSQEKQALMKKLDETKTTLQEERIKYETKLMELTEVVDIRQGELFDKPEQFIKKELKLQQLQNTEHLNNLLEDINRKLEIVHKHQEKILDAKLEIEQQKVYLKASEDLKEQMNNQIERIKLSYDGEVKLLKEDRRRLEELREALQIQLVEKDCELQIAKAKLKHLEKQKSKDIEHADMMCKISDQLMRALKKLEKR